MSLTRHYGEGAYGVDMVLEMMGAPALQHVSLFAAGIQREKHGIDPVPALGRVPTSRPRRRPGRDRLLRKEEELNGCDVRVLLYISRLVGQTPFAS